MLTSELAWDDTGTQLGAVFITLLNVSYRFSPNALGPQGTTYL
jgi:hypothetical protein